MLSHWANDGLPADVDNRLNIDRVRIVAPGGRFPEGR